MPMRARTITTTGGWVARGLILGALTAVLAAPVGAAQARHVSIEIDESFQDGFLTDVCGTPVTTSIEASLNVTVRYNRAGLIVAEIDPSGGGTVTVLAPETGGSFSFPFSTNIIDYGTGATVGSEFTIRLAGLAGHVPGFVESDAGQVLFAGVVSGFDDLGLPTLQFTDVLFEAGHRADGDDVIAAICAVLNP
jgi:hypothetical protein